MRSTRILFVLLLTLCAALPAYAHDPNVTVSAEDKKFNDLLDAEWEWVMKEYPTFATAIGDVRYNDKVAEETFEAIERRRKRTRDQEKKLATIQRSKLSPENQLNYDLLQRDLREDIEGQRFPSEFTPLNQMGGVHGDMAELSTQIPKSTVKDFEDFIARLETVPVSIDAHIARMRKGVEKGITPPSVTLKEVGGLISNQIVDDPTRSASYENVFKEMPSSISAADQQRLRARATKVLQEKVIPAYRKFHKFTVEEYLPKARKTIGLSALPDGLAWYAHRVKAMTTTDLTPDQIHNLGLSEVKRIRGEMEKIRVQTNFKGDLQAFFNFLRTDPQFFFTNKEDLLREYRDISKRVDPELPKLFGRLPQLPYGVIPIPAYSEKTNTTAYYNSGSLEAGRPGYFYANTYDLKMRPKWEMEALTLHEAVPGHHLQISIAQELGELPKFRRFGGYTAYIEGWGLYAESLGPELGMYKDPYSKFGQLTYEMWRAVRLVVDTGMHSKGWTRDQAINFFKENTSKTQHDIEVEVDRYIVWPGQALAYKIGELKLKELRAFATKELGAKFSIRKFHDVVLGAGALPLSILESRVKDWVAKEKTGG